MSYYQLNSRNGSLYDATFISTSGSPSKEQFQGVFREAPQAEHHLCFDRDRAGQLFAVNFALTKSRNNFTTVITDDGILKVSDMKNNYEFRMDDFNFDAIAKELGIEEAWPEKPSYLSEKPEKHMTGTNLSVRNTTHQAIRDLFVKKILMNWGNSYARRNSNI